MIVERPRGHTVASLAAFYSLRSDLLPSKAHTGQSRFVISGFWSLCLLADQYGRRSSHSICSTNTPRFASANAVSICYPRCSYFSAVYLRNGCGIASFCFQQFYTTSQQAMHGPVRKPTTSDERGVAVALKIAVNKRCSVYVTRSLVSPMGQHACHCH